MIGSFCLAQEVSMETAWEIEKAALPYYPYASWSHCTLIRSLCPAEASYLISLDKGRHWVHCYTVNFLSSSACLTLQIQFQRTPPLHLPSGPSSSSSASTTRRQMKRSISLSSPATMLKFYKSFLQPRRWLWKLLIISPVILGQAGSGSFSAHCIQMSQVALSVISPLTAGLSVLIQ